MPTYILLSSLTPQGVQTLKSNPDRLREVNRDVEELGAKVLHQWATLGEYDFIHRLKLITVNDRVSRGASDCLSIGHRELNVLLDALHTNLFQHLRRQPGDWGSRR